MSSSRLILPVPEQLAFVSVARPSKNHPTFQLSAERRERFEAVRRTAESHKVFDALEIRLSATKTNVVMNVKGLPKCLREIFVIPVIGAPTGNNWFNVDSIFRWRYVFDFRNGVLSTNPSKHAPGATARHGSSSQRMTSFPLGTFFVIGISGRVSPIKKKELANFLGCEG